MSSSGSQEVVCILCPVGCRLRARKEGGRVAVKGAHCDRGTEYASSEFISPLRVFTGTVRVDGGTRPVVSVKSDRPVPRQRLLDVARAAARITSSAPVAASQVISEDLPGGARLVATANVARAHGDASG